MSEFTLLDITIDPFDPSSVRYALQKVNDIKAKLQPAMELLVKQMAEKGVEIARAFLVDYKAYDTGELSDSVRAEVKEDTAVIAAGYHNGNGFYAAYIEFGTGIIGGMQDDGTIKEGYRQTGWVYFNERIGRFVFTTGMAARPFMHDTYESLIIKAEAEGGKIIAEYIA